MLPQKIYFEMKMYTEYQHAYFGREHFVNTADREQ